MKFTSEDSGVHAMKLTGRASGFVAPGGEPYKFTKIPVTMNIGAVWKHLKVQSKDQSHLTIALKCHFQAHLRQ